MSIENELSTEKIAENEVENVGVEEKEGETDGENSGNSDDSMDKDGWFDILGSGVVKKKILVPGKDETKPERLAKIIIDYECTLEDGTLVEKAENFEMELGGYDVIQGMDVAIGLMNVGEEALVRIEPRLAYGTKGLPPYVEPDSNILVKIKLISSTYEEEPEFLSISERKLKGNSKRERGNWWYGRGEYTMALCCYRRALNYLDEVEGGIKDPLPDGVEEVTDAALQDLLECRISVCNNLAATQIKQKNYDSALTSLKTVLTCQPNNVKALFRQAKIFRAKNDPQTALKSLKKAQKISPKDADIDKEIKELEALILKQKNREKELAKKMFSDINSGEKATKSSKKVLIWTTTCISLLVSLVAVATYRYKPIF